MNRNANGQLSLGIIHFVEYICQTKRIRLLSEPLNNWRLIKKKKDSNKCINLFAVCSLHLYVCIYVVTAMQSLQGFRAIICEYHIYLT